MFLAPRVRFGSNIWSKSGSSDILGTLSVSFFYLNMIQNRLDFEIYLGQTLFLFISIQEINVLEPSSMSFFVDSRKTEIDFENISQASLFIGSLPSTFVNIHPLFYYFSLLLTFLRFACNPITLFFELLSFFVTNFERLFKKELKCSHLLFV